MARTTHDSDAPSDKDRGKTTLAPGTQARLKERGRSRGLRLQETGRNPVSSRYGWRTGSGDAGRGSRVGRGCNPFQPGARAGPTGRRTRHDHDDRRRYRSPLDPTTAAVPASEHSQIAREVGGTPTVGSDGRGEPEERWWPGDVEGGPIERLRNLPTQEERNKKEEPRQQKTDPRKGDGERGPRKPTGVVTARTKPLTGLPPKW